jgi:hypothetical protein
LTEALACIADCAFPSVAKGCASVPALLSLPLGET